jgi:hypothetical protein
VTEDEEIREAISIMETEIGVLRAAQQIVRGPLAAEIRMSALDIARRVIADWNKGTVR